MATLARTLCAGLALVLSGCATVREVPVEVPVPVPVPADVPAALAEPLTLSPAPVFVAPVDPSASSCLTPDGEAALKQFVGEPIIRLRAWEAWGAEQTRRQADD